MRSRTQGIVARFGRHLVAVTGSALAVLLASLCVAASATAAVGAATATMSAASAPATTTTTTATTLPPAPAPGTPTSPTTPTSTNPPATAAPPSPAGTTTTTSSLPTAAPTTPTPTPTPTPAPATPPVTQPCSGGGAGAGTASSGAAGASSPPTATSAPPPAGGGLSCGTPTTAVPAASATVTTGGVVTGDAAGHSDPAPSQPSMAPSMGGGAVAPAKTPTPISTGSEPAQPAPTQAPRAPHGGGSGVRLLTRFPARNAGAARARRTGSRPKATKRAGDASWTAASPHRPGAATAGAGNPLVRHVAGASAPRSPALAPAHDSTLRDSSAASLEVSPAHGMRRSHDRSSPAVFAAPQPDVFPAAHGGRPTRGVGVVAPGGTGAPSSLLVRVGFAPVAASWLAGVTGEAIHLRFPVTHRLERPG